MRALFQQEVDEYGLDKVDRRIMRLLIKHYGGGPAGLKALAASVGEDQGTIEDFYEPYLVQKGFLQRTPRGRVATPARIRTPGPAGPRHPLLKRRTGLPATRSGADPDKTVAAPSATPSSPVGFRRGQLPGASERATPDDIAATTDQPEASEAE